MPMIPVKLSKVFSRFRKAIKCPSDYQCDKKWATKLSTRYSVDHLPERDWGREPRGNPEEIRMEILSSYNFLDYPKF